MAIEVGQQLLVWSTDENIRSRGASGGAVTALMITALSEGFAEKAVGVQRKGHIEGEIGVVASPEDVKTFTGSIHTAPLNLYKKVNSLQGKVIFASKPCDTKPALLNSTRGQKPRNEMIILGLNCGGTIEPDIAAEMFSSIYQISPEEVKSEEILGGKLIVETKTGEHKAVSIDDLEEQGYGRRHNCQRCIHKIPQGVDLACGNWGVPQSMIGKATYIDVQTEKGRDLLEKASETGRVATQPVEEKFINRRAKVNDFMVNLGRKWRSRFYSPVEEKTGLSRLETILEAYRECDLCVEYGTPKCREVCPVCLCQEAKCLEFSKVDKFGPEGNKILFHMIRHFHMLDLCVGCGACSTACHKGIDVAAMITRMAYKHQEKMNWFPGMSEGKPPILDVR
ncbi:MAG: Coenzyme F420 hydrogenase/dehydrogenase, beta subunit C-terminal domain [Candidatus Hodarchaeota archaeon]